VVGFFLKRILKGKRWFLLGVLRFWGCFVVVNRGEVVVNCVVICGELHHNFQRLKTRQLFEIYFW
jgi:hypothetical protein